LQTCHAFFCHEPNLELKTHPNTLLGFIHEQTLTSITIPGPSFQL
jgi:hypothetical protein